MEIYLMQVSRACLSADTVAFHGMGILVRKIRSDLSGGKKEN